MIKNEFGDLPKVNYGSLQAIIFIFSSKDSYSNSIMEKTIAHFDVNAKSIYKYHHCKGKTN